MTALAIPVRNPLRRVGAGLGWLATGMIAVGTKELRGRMRGRRAFAVLTFYLVLLSVFAWGIFEFQRNAAAMYATPWGGIGFPSVALSAQIGQSLFSGLLVIETLLVAVLAPAFTSGAISLEREKQTLDLLVATPLSSFALVAGKLISALAYVFLLILASVPLAAIVFLFGGVGPEDLVRGYLVLFAVAIGFGAIGLFVSALVRRTQVATVLTYLTVLALSIGTAVVWFFLYATSGISQVGGVVPGSGNTSAGRPAQQILWLNPFIADLDLICGTSSSGYDVACSIISAVTGKPYFGTTFGGVSGFDAAGGAVAIGVAPCPPNARCAAPAVLADVVGPEPIQQPTVTGLPRDAFWPQSAAAFIATALLLTFLSAQLVAPTRRLVRLPRRRRHAPEAST